MSVNKIVSLENASRMVAAHRVKGLDIVFTNGCFDILHAGHIKTLRAAKALGDFLIVGLNTDASVRRLKGNDRPIQDEHTRAKVLASLLPVDLVVLFDEDTPVRLIRSLRPDVLAKGGDWALDQIAGADVVLKNGGKVHAIPLEPGYSTTSAIEKIIKQCKSNQ